jgi:cellulose synthase (UDP-forming)
VAWETGRPKPLALSELPQHPSVDVFIATYNEPLPMLRTTVAGALTMRYPGTVNVYLCDDGERETVRALAEDFGVGYLTRTEHSHAKAGNLNNAMALSSGELIVTLDADMVPTAEFLERTVGHFADPTMAFVQAPQAFSNDDPFQYNLFSAAALPNEQDFFMRTLLAGKARFNAVMYVGSNTVFRRTALDEIGGFATGVITEDMATGMLLQSHGWRAEFVPDIVAAGAAPESFEDLLVQRDRWARGNVQTARKWNPLTLPGLSAMQRWLYADGVLYWYFGVFKFVYFLAPILFLLFGIAPLRTDVLSLVVMWLPQFLCGLIAFRIVADGRRSFIWSHIYELAMAPTLAVSVLAESFGLKVNAFKVTPKGELRDARQFGFRAALPHLIAIALSVAALVVASGSFDEPELLTILIVSVFWALYNLIGSIAAVFLCVERPRLRGAERTRVDLPVEVEFGDLVVEAAALDLSVTGTRVVVPWSSTLRPQDLSVRDGRARAVVVPGVGRLAGESSWVSADDSGVTFGFSFAPMPPQQFVPLVGSITASPFWVRGDREERSGLGGALGRTVVANARRSSIAARAEVRHFTRAKAQIVPVAGSRSGSGAPEPVDVRVEDLSFAGCRVRSGVRFEPGDLVEVQIPGVLGDPVAGEIRWVTGRNAPFRLGIKLSRQDAADLDA